MKENKDSKAQNGENVNNEPEQTIFIGRMLGKIRIPLSAATATGIGLSTAGYFSKQQELVEFGGATIALTGSALALSYWIPFGEKMLKRMENIIVDFTKRKK